MAKKYIFQEKSIKAEIQEVKSYKFKVALEDGSLTPWQVSDHNPSKKDLEDVKNLYTKPAKKKRLKQSVILQSYKNKGMLAYKPGWHLKDVPIARKFEKVNPLNRKKELFPAEFVWAECEYACNVDYQNEAMKNRYTENDSFRHSPAGLQKVPENDCYCYRTNPDPTTEEWIITGKIKVKKIVSDREVDDLCLKAVKKPQKREKDVLRQIESMKRKGE